MKIKQILVGVLLAPLSLAEPVWAENLSRILSVEIPAANRECEIPGMVIPVEAEVNVLPTETRSPECFNLTQQFDQAEQTVAILFQALEFAQNITNPAKKARSRALMRMRLPGI